MYLEPVLEKPCAAGVAGLGALEQLAQVAAVRRSHPCAGIGQCRYCDGVQAGPLLLVWKAGRLRRRAGEVASLSREAACWERSPTPPRIAGGDAEQERSGGTSPAQI